MKNKITVFALSASEELAKDIAKELGTNVGKSKVHHFADGEILVEIGESVRGKDVYIVQSTSNPVTENLMEILVLADALKRASAKEITAIIPYFGYARQDRKAKPRQPITSKLIADLLTVAGINRVVTVDLHAAQIQGFFDIPVDHLMGAPLIADYFERIGLTGENGDVVVVSPDHGGVTRARKLADFLKTPIAIIDKRRPRANVAEIMNIIGDVKGKKCVLIDDMIDTAGTITLAANALKALGATDIYASCTHGVLSGPALERIESSSITKLVVTDTIELPQSIRESEKITEISISALIADAIIRIHENRPLSPLFQMRVKSEDLV